MRRPARASLADVPVLRNSDRAVAGRPRRRADGGGANDHLGQRRNPARAAIRAPRCGRLAVERADAGTRTPDPIITREPEEADGGPSEGAEGRERPAHCPHCGGLLEPTEDPRERSDVRGGYAAE